MSYDYIEAVKKDIRKYIDEQYDLSLYYGTDPDYLKWDFQDDQALRNYAKGKPKGFNIVDNANAKIWVNENIDDLCDACNEYSIFSEEVGERFLSEDWIWFDEIIRNYFIDLAIEEIVEEFVSDHII